MREFSTRCHTPQQRGVRLCAASTQRCSQAFPIEPHRQGYENTSSLPSRIKRGRDRRAFGARRAPSPSHRAGAVLWFTSPQCVEKSREKEPSGPAPPAGPAGCGVPGQAAWAWVSRGDWSCLQCWVSACPDPGLRVRADRPAAQTAPSPSCAPPPQHLSALGAWPASWKDWHLLREAQATSSGPVAATPVPSAPHAPQRAGQSSRTAQSERESEAATEPLHVGSSTNVLWPRLQGKPTRRSLR